jgi:hypothetical protein
MKIIKFFSLLSLLFVFSTATSQEFKLGKVSVAELQEKAHPKDTSAVAAILFKNGKSKIEYDQNDGFVVLTEVETRIKIYKKEGYDWANQSVGYYLGNNTKETVSFSEANTFNLVNGKVEKTKLKSDGVFDETVNKYRGRKKITMPNVKEGSIIEYKYVVRTDNIGWMRDWKFQTSIPVNYSEYITYVPEYYVFNVRQKGFFATNVVTEKKPKTISFTNKERSGDRVVQTTYSTNNVDYIETKTTYTAEGLPAMKDESYVNNIDNYTLSLEHELAVVKYPDSPVKAYSSDWNSVVKTIYNYDDFGPELNKSGYFEDNLKALLANVNTPDERIMVVLNHVKSNVKWNNLYGYSCDNGVKKAYKEKTGNVADINLMLTAMLRYAGLNADPVLVSTRDNGISLFPNRTAYNYVIAAVETPNGNVLLDATDKFAVPNILPTRDLNWHGRLIRKDGTSEDVDLMPKKSSNDVVFLTYEIDAEGKVTGKTRRQCTDYNALITRHNIDNVKQEAYLENLENENDKIEISEYTRTNENEILLPTIETYSFTGNNLCEIIGGKIYVSPMLFFTNSENPFKQEVREYPVDFGFPFVDKYNITIKIPEGYTVETLPAKAVINMEEDLGSFKFNISTTDNVLQLAISHQINQPIVATEMYPMLKDYYQAMIAKQTEKIVLKKI